MYKYKNTVWVLGCVLCMMTAHANSQTLEDKAWQYAQQAILERLGEKDRELTAEEREIADEIVKSYLSLHKKHNQSLTQSQMAKTPPIASNQKHEVLAKELLALKKSMHEFFLDRNFGIHRSALVYPDESSGKTALTDETDDKTAESQIDNQTNHKDDKADEK